LSCRPGYPGFKVGGAKLYFQGRKIFLLLLYVSNRFFWAQQYLGALSDPVAAGRHG